jgi:hypothetical protein
MQPQGQKVTAADRKSSGPVGNCCENEFGYDCAEIAEDHLAGVPCSADEDAAGNAVEGKSR